MIINKNAFGFIYIHNTSLSELESMSSRTTRATYGDETVSC